MVRFDRTTVMAAFLASVACALPAQDEVWIPDGLHMSVYALAASPLGVRYAATNTGLFRSTEAGIWAALEDSPANATVLAVDPTDPDVVYAGGKWGLDRSLDGGHHFQRLIGAPIEIVQLALDPLSPGNLYVSGGKEGRVVAGWGIHKSTDGGATWSDLVVPPFSRYLHRFRTLVVDPTRPGFVYAGSDLSTPESLPHELPTFIPPAPVIRSTNAGVYWLPVMRREQERVRTQALAIDSFTGAVYAAAHAPGDEVFEGVVFRSTDAGATWTRASLGFGVRVTALLPDPNEADVVYAATAEDGVLRSVDGGASWSPMGTGLSPGDVRSLAFDPSDGLLRAGTDRGVFAIRIAPARPVCTPAADVLCLLGGRYRVDVAAENPRTGRSAAGIAIPGGNRFGSFSLPTFTGDPTLPEVFVKVVKSPGSPLWIFYGGLTSLPYALTVTDMVTGRIETYSNAPGNRFCGGVDGDAFPEGGDGADSCAGCWDYVREAGAASSEGLSQLEGRFSITLSAFSSRHNRTEPGVAVAKTDRYGYFTLPGFTGDATFPEVHVKMIDHTAVSGNFWLFHTGLTSLDYTLTVTDLVTGQVRTFLNTGDFCGSAHALPGAR